MKVLVTGASGFLGTHLQKELKDRGYTDVVALNSRIANLMNKEEAEAVFKYIEPNVIIHAAARCGGIGANKNSPASFLRENLIMNTNVVDAAHKVYMQMRSMPFPSPQLRKFIGLGSVCSYPKHCPVPFSEESLWDGFPEETNAPYGLSKRMLCMQIMTYRQQWHFPGIFLIPVNLYGPSDHFDLNSSHVIPALIRKFYEAKLAGLNVVELWGTGQASREFLYVKDAAKAIIDAMEKYEGDEPINLGSGKEITIKELADIIVNKVDFKGKTEWNTNMPDGQPRRCLDVSKAEKHFGFVAQTSFENGIDETVAWYIENREAILEGELR